MIEDSKFVQSVASNSPKKGWKITWADGKYDNFFDEAWLPILDSAQKNKRLVNFQKEKNAAGYWNLVSLELAEAPSDEPQAPVMYPKEEIGVKSVVTPKANDTRNRAFENSDRAISIERQVSIKLAFENAPENSSIDYIFGFADSIYKWISLT